MWTKTCLCVYVPVYVSGSDHESKCVFEYLRDGVGLCISVCVSLCCRREYVCVGSCACEVWEGQNTV